MARRDNGPRASAGTAGGFGAPSARRGMALARRGMDAAGLASSAPARPSLRYVFRIGGVASHDRPAQGAAGDAGSGPRRRESARSRRGPEPVRARGPHGRPVFTSRAGGAWVRIHAVNPGACPADAQGDGGGAVAGAAAARGRERGPVDPAGRREPGPERASAPAFGIRFPAGRLSAGGGGRSPRCWPARPFRRPPAVR